MTSVNCERIDGYLGKCLSEPERTAFEGHVAQCPNCQQSLRENERIDRILTLNPAPVPPLLVGQIERLIHRTRRRRLVGVGAGLLAASVLIGFLIFQWWSPPRQPGEPAPNIAEVTPVLEKVAPVEVTFASNANVIALSKKTDNPNVTIIWLYPTVQTALQADAPLSDSIPNHERGES